jgi:RNA polymerase sigma factor (sigma-70 family)
MPEFVELRDTLCYNLADDASDPLYQTLYELIDSLDNDSDREIMYLYLAKKKYSEIARETGTTESAVKQRIYRIKKKLKQLNEQQQ